MIKHCQKSVSVAGVLLWMFGSCINDRDDRAELTELLFFISLFPPWPLWCFFLIYIRFNPPQHHAIFFVLATTPVFDSNTAISDLWEGCREGGNVIDCAPHVALQAGN